MPPSVKGKDVRPELKAALSVVVEALAYQNAIKLVSLPSSGLYTGMKAFFPFLVLASHLPHAPEWKWRQNGRRKVFKPPSGRAITIMKLSPRPLDGLKDVEAPKAKAWLAWVTTTGVHQTTFLWVERGTEENEKPATDVARSQHVFHCLDDSGSVPVHGGCTAQSQENATLGSGQAYASYVSGSYKGHFSAELDPASWTQGELEVLAGRQEETSTLVLKCMGRTTTTHTFPGLLSQASKSRPLGEGDSKATLSHSRIISSGSWQEECLEESSHLPSLSRPLSDSLPSAAFVRSKEPSRSLDLLDLPIGAAESLLLRSFESLW